MLYKMFHLFGEWCY